MNTMDRNQVINDVIKRFIDNDQYNSIEWKVERKGEIFSSGSRGGNISLEQENSTIYRIYSMTKPIVAVAAIKAIEHGLLRLYDPICNYFDCFKNQMVISSTGKLEHAKTLINIEQLLTHKSGLSYGFEAGCPVGNLYARKKLLHKSDLDLRDFIKEVGNFPLAFHPGEGWRYSVSIDVVAGVLEVIYQKPLDKILQEIVFEPLGMNETKFFVHEKDMDRVAPIYGDDNIDSTAIFRHRTNKLIKSNVEGFYPSDPKKAKPRGGHGLFSTVDDYHKFASMLCTGFDKNGKRFISEKMMDFALINRIDGAKLPLIIDTFELPGYGYNLIGRVMIDQSKALSLTGKTEFGWAGAGSTYFWVDREESLTGVIMAQYLWSNIPFAEEIKAAVYQAL